MRCRTPAQCSTHVTISVPISIQMGGHDPHILTLPIQLPIDGGPVGELAPCGMHFS